MEKPRKKEVFPCPFCGNVIFDEFIWKGRRRVQCNNQICPIHGFQMDIDDWNTRAMSTWLEGEVPTVEEIEKVLDETIESCCLKFKGAKAIHALITRKLTGKV